MVDVVQLVEHQVVILAVAGSSPVIHPDRTAPNLHRRWGQCSFHLDSPCSHRPPSDSFEIT